LIKPSESVYFSGNGNFSYNLYYREIMIKIEFTEEDIKALN